MAIQRRQRTALDGRHARHIARYRLGNHQPGRRVWKPLGVPQFVSERRLRVRVENEPHRRDLVAVTAIGDAHVHPVDVVDLDDGDSVAFGRHGELSAADAPLGRGGSSGNEAGLAPAEHEGVWRGRSTTSRQACGDEDESMHTNSQRTWSAQPHQVNAPKNHSAGLTNRHVVASRRPTATLRVRDAERERRAGLIVTVITVALAAATVGLVVGAGLFGAFGGGICK